MIIKAIPASDRGRQGKLERVDCLENLERR